MNNCRGTALVVLLLFLLLLSLLSVSSFTSSYLSLKMASIEQSQMKLFYAAEQSLNTIERTLSQSTTFSCLLPRRFVNDYTDQNDSWWLSAAPCHLKNDRYQISYIIEQLDLAPCSRIVKFPKEIPRYYRITLYADLVTGNFPVKLQSTFAIPEKVEPELVCPRKQFVTISYGRQSWREI